MGYPAWFQAYLDAPTESLPGFFGDWLDLDCKVEEDAASITLFHRDDFDDPYEKQVTFYSDDQRSRRVNLVLWLYQIIVTGALADAYGKHPELREDHLFTEMPIRLTFNESHATKILGKEWA